MTNTKNNCPSVSQFSKHLLRPSLLLICCSVMAADEIQLRPTGQAYIKDSLHGMPNRTHILWTNPESGMSLHDLPKSTFKTAVNLLEKAISLHTKSL
jgi:hypothetical protein